MFFFFFISFYFICNVCNVNKTEKWGRGVNCEEEIREKNEMGEGGMYVCGGGEEKRKTRGTWVVGEKKRKKEIGSGVNVYGGKNGEWKRKKKK